MDGKPRLRGVLHQWAAGVWLAAGGAVVVEARTAVARAAATIYAAAMSGLFAASAALHRGRWSAAGLRRMRRLDHSMIFVAIAGTYTPVALLGLGGWLGTALLAVVWAGAAAGVLLKVALPRLSSWVHSLYLVLGWLAVVVLPWLWRSLGPAGFGLIVAGGLLYTAGAVVLALRRPDPLPAVFGYHEVFHALVVAAAAAHLGAVARLVT